MDGNKHLDSPQRGPTRTVGGLRVGRNKKQVDKTKIISGPEAVREHNPRRPQEVQRPRLDGVLQRQRLRRVARQGLRKIHQQQLSD